MMGERLDVPVEVVHVLAFNKADEGTGRDVAFHCGPGELRFRVPFLLQTFDTLLIERTAVPDTWEWRVPTAHGDRPD